MDPLEEARVAFLLITLLGLAGLALALRLRRTCDHPCPTCANDQALKRHREHLERQREDIRIHQDWHRRWGEADCWRCRRNAQRSEKNDSER